MAEPFLSEIRLMSFSFAPKSWATCDGQFLPINQNQALFSLLGTTYGGNGQTTFALPDMRGRVPIHFGSGYTLGEKGGQEAHTLTSSEMPGHVHQFYGATADANVATPGSTVLVGKAPLDMFRDPTHLVAMEPALIGSVGGSQAHQNMQPFLTISFCIALQGIFPSQT